MVNESDSDYTHFSCSQRPGFTPALACVIEDGELREFTQHVVTEHSLVL